MFRYSVDPEALGGCDDPGEDTERHVRRCICVSGDCTPATLDHENAAARRTAEATRLIGHAVLRAIGWPSGRYPRQVATLHSCGRHMNYSLGQANTGSQELAGVRWLSQ
jgi:hypothetical protein